MKRKLIPLLLALMLCLSMAVPAAAADDTYVVDEWGVLATSELEELNGLAEQIYDATGVAVFFILTNEAELEDYDISGHMGYRADYFVMIDNDSDWDYYAGGDGEKLDKDALRAAYDAYDTYVDGIEQYLLAADEALPARSSVSDHSGDTYEESDGPAFDWVKYGLISLGIGLVVGLITVLILKGQLKSVRKQNQANNYERPGSMHLTMQSDIYLYRNVTRVKRQTNNSK